MTLLSDLQPIQMVYALAMIGVLAIFALPFLIYERFNVLRRVGKLEENASGKVVPEWTWFQSQIIRRLHPKTPRAAELLKLLNENPDCPMTDDDRNELLNGLVLDGVSVSEADSKLAHVLPIVMEEAQKEAANPNPITTVQLIGA